MAHTLEGIKGGGGSIKLGTTGTISTLMTRELDQISYAANKQVSSRSNPRVLPVSVACGTTTHKRLQPRKSSSDEASGSGSSSINTKLKTSGISQKTKPNGRNNHRMPMLSSDDFPVDRTPSRQKSDKKIPTIVEVVDIKCGNADKACANPLTSRLKKLGFSKLSESFI